MKKTLIAMAVLGAASSFAMAASNVTLYGRIDTGFGIEKAKGHSAVVSETSGKMTGNRWGIKGVEDLGNGYSVGFVLEQGFNSDNGTASEADKQFRRESSLFVTGDFGKVGFGRFGGLSSDAGSYTILTGWQFGTSYGATADLGKFAKVSSRMDNSVAYVAPAVGGVTVTAMYSNDSADKEDSDKKWSENSHYYGLGAKAAWGAFSGSAIFEVKDNKAVADSEPSYAITVGGNQKFEAFTLSGLYQYAWQDDEYKQHVAAVSSAIPLAGGTAKLGVKGLMGEFDDAAHAEGEDKYRAWSVNAAYEYPLSKRTTVYGYAGYTDGDKLYKDTEKLEFNGYAIYAGLVHKF